MNDLFDHISQRFSGTIQPAIRPRPQSRFEGQDTGETLTEEAGSDLVTAPQDRPGRPAPDAAPLAEPLPAPSPRLRDIPHHPAALEASPPDPVGPQDENLFHLPQHPQPPGSEADPAARAQTRHSLPPAPGAEANTPPPLPPPPEGDRDNNTETIREIHREHRIETRRFEPERALANPAEPGPAPVLEVTHDAPRTTIRIGRVEMRQPPAPAPSPAPNTQPPPRQNVSAPVRGGADRIGRGSGSGGLTDYLGWKRR